MQKPKSVKKNSRSWLDPNLRENNHAWIPRLYYSTVSIEDTFSQIIRYHPAWVISTASYYYSTAVLDKVFWYDMYSSISDNLMQSESPQRRCQHTSSVPCCCCVGSVRWRWPGEQLLNSEQCTTSLRFVVPDDGDGDGVLWRESVAFRHARYHRQLAVEMCRGRYPVSCTYGVPL